MNFALGFFYLKIDGLKYCSKQRIHVNFLNAGAKWLVLAYANLAAR